MEKLKRTLENLEGVHENFKTLYEQRDGKFVMTGVDFDDLVKSNNTLKNEKLGVLKERDSLKVELAKFSDVDLEEYQELKQKRSDYENEQLVASGKIEEAVALKTAAMKEAHVKELQAIKDTVKDRESQISNLTDTINTKNIEDRVRSAVTNLAKVRPGSMKYVLQDAKNVWRADADGNIKPYKDDGELLYSSESAEPMSMEEWAKGLINSAPNLFEPSQGGGASGSTTGSTSPTINGIVPNTNDSFLQNLDAIAKGTVKVAVSA